MPDTPEDPTIAMVAPPLDPTTGFPIDIFCSGHAQLPDGRVAIIGGGNGYPSSHAHTIIFDPDATPPDPEEVWKVMDSMPPGEPTGTDPKGKRWYPTCTTLSDGRVLVVGGDDYTQPESADIPLIFDVTKPPGQQYTELGNSALHLPYYPFMFQLSDGKVVYAGAAWPITDPTEDISKTLDPILGQWTDVVTSPPAGGTAVMYRPDLILKGGGGHDIPGTSDMYTLDATSQSPQWTPVTPMIRVRWEFYLIALPDGNVLAIGGKDTSGASPPIDAVLEPELYKPDADTWEELAPMDATPNLREHHATAVLLPDARILIAGGHDMENAQIFRPPYLYDDQGTYLDPGDRPQITAVDGQSGELKAIYYGEQITITMASAPQSTPVVRLIRPGAATHHFDQDQRSLSLNIIPPGGGQPPEDIKVAAPANGGEAPPGYYMLFVIDTVDTRAVPSVAQMVRLGHDCDANGTVDYEDLASCAGNPDCSDCNRNGVQDACDISGSSADTNGDGIPDECDCNLNSVVDSLEMASCTADPNCDDCNANLILDGCDIASGFSEDTDLNSIPDECDCNSNSVLDSLDIASCTADPNCDDCNANLIPDGCDIATGFSVDNDSNSIPDECEFGPPLAAPHPHYRRKNRYISFDPNKLGNDGLNVAFQVELKQITLGSCNGTPGSPPEVDFCRTDRSGADCNKCSVGDNACISEPIDCAPQPPQTCDSTGAVCINDLPSSGGSNVGLIWWVGPESDLGNGVHLLVSDVLDRKESTDWPNPTHVGDCEIVPQARYGIRAVAGLTSDELEVETTQFDPVTPPAPFWWGDCVGPLKKFCGGDIRGKCDGTGQLCQQDTDCLPGQQCITGRCGGTGPECLSDDDCTSPDLCEYSNGCTSHADCTFHETCDLAWTLPDGTVNFDDINAVLALERAGATMMPPDITWVDLHGNDSGLLDSENFDPPDFGVDVSDLQNVLFAFEGRPYPFYDPADCPADTIVWPREEDWPDLDPETTTTFTLVASDDLLDPTQDLLIEVYVDEATNVWGHEVALEVTGGTSGTLTVTDITVDTNRSDYMFYDISQTPLEAKNLPEKRVGNSLPSAGPGVSKTGQVYLATFTFQPSGGANGVFHIDVRGAGRSFLVNADGSAQETIATGCVAVAVGVDCLNDAHCDDNNECATDSCTANNECQYDNVASGTACDDGLWCTRGAQTCDGNGLCTGGAPRCPPGYLCDEGGQQCFGAPPP